MSCGGVNLTEDTFGQIKNDEGKLQTVRRFTWTNCNKVKIQLINYGGYITAIEFPDKNGKIEDVVIGFNTIEEYLQPSNQYFGATIGRVANRIKNGEMTVDNVKYKLAINNGPNHLHGGIKGFDKVFWDAHVVGTKVVLSYLSKDMEEGYPGDLLVNVTFELNQNNEFLMNYKATTTKVTPVNLTNHSYFNLAGNGKGSDEILNHVVMINADKITPVDDNLIPTGQFQDVSGTIFDLRVPKKLGDVFPKTPNSIGYDHNFCITKGSKQEIEFAAQVVHPETGRVLEIYTDQPGVQFYTGCGMPTDDSLKGKIGPIKQFGGFCLETQVYPDSINQKNFPNMLLQPGDEYHHTAIFKFYLQK